MPTLHDISCTSCQNHKDKDRCVPPSPRPAPASGLRPAPALSDIASPFAAAPVSARAPAQNPATSAAIPQREPPRWPPRRRRQKPVLEQPEHSEPAPLAEAELPPAESA